MINRSSQQSKPTRWIVLLLAAAAQVAAQNKTVSFKVNHVVTTVLSSGDKLTAKVISQSGPTFTVQVSASSTISGTMTARPRRETSRVKKAGCAQVESVS